MPITVNSNPLQRQPISTCPRTTMLCKRGNRLSSGSKIVHPNDDAGGLAVSHKTRECGYTPQRCKKNIQNGISFLEVQDGVLANAARS